MDALSLQLLHDGRVFELAKHLKRYFFLDGVVVRGKSYGSSINFPTINLLFVSAPSLPKLGCYLTLVYINNQYYPGLTCLIEHPDNKALVACETHLQNFDYDVYGDDARVIFLEFFRTNIPFSLWKEKHLQIIAQDKQQWQRDFTVQRKWLPWLQKNVKIESNTMRFSDG